MKTSQEILDAYGKKMVKECYDPGIANLIALRDKENPPKIFEDYVNFLNSLDKEDFDILKKYLKYSHKNMIFNILKIFEESEQFKLVYQENNKQINLVEISEMLKAEHMIENGWIDRFSKFAKDDEAT